MHQLRQTRSSSKTSETSFPSPSPACSWLVANLGKEHDQDPLPLGESISPTHFHNHVPSLGLVVAILLAVIVMIARILSSCGKESKHDLSDRILDVPHDLHQTQPGTSPAPFDAGPPTADEADREPAPIINYNFC